MKIKKMIMVKIKIWNNLLRYIKPWKLVERIEKKKKVILEITIAQINSIRNMCNNNHVLQIYLKLNNLNNQVTKFLLLTLIGKYI